MSQSENEHWFDYEKFLPRNIKKMFLMLSKQFCIVNKPVLLSKMFWEHEGRKCIDVIFGQILKTSWTKTFA